MSSAKFVRMALINYTDQDGIDRTQLAVVGDQSVILVNGKEFGISAGRATPSGFVEAPWLRDGIFKALTDGEAEAAKKSPTED